jgi:hypothetical protein
MNIAHVACLMAILEVVAVDLIPQKSFHIYCNNRFVLQVYTHSQFCTNFKHTSIYSSSKH